jgi:endonuclease/exonuclease/phosphatase family metal-dependent hydrolase
MQLRVLTLNVWALPFGLSRHTRARLDAIGARLAELDADLVACQEVWTAEARSRLVQAGRAAGYHSVWHRDAALGGSGLLVLARRPLRTTSFKRFTLEGLPQRVQHADYYGGKGFVVLEVGVGESTVHVVDTHLHAGYGSPGEPDEYRGIRVAQTTELAAAVCALEGPVIALGDWNFTDSDPEHAILTGLSGLRDAALVLGDPLPTVLADHPYRGRGAAAERIDRVFVRDGAALRVRIASLRRVLDEPIEIASAPGAYSDHAGLLAELSIEPMTRGEGRPLHPDEDALDLASAWLTRGEGIARARSRGDLGIALGGLAAAGGLGAAARRTRRGLLRAALAGAAALALSGGAVFAWLGLVFAHDEQAGYAHVRAVLRSLSGDED